MHIGWFGIVHDFLVEIGDDLGFWDFATEDTILQHREGIQYPRSWKYVNWKPMRIFFSCNI